MFSQRTVESLMSKEENSEPRTTPATAFALLREAEVRLTRKLIEKADAGNLPALLFIMERVYPKQPTTTQIDLPDVGCDYDAWDAFPRLIKAAATGKIPVSQAQAIATMLARYATADRGRSLEARVSALEADRPLLRMYKEMAQKSPPTAKAANTGVGVPPGGESASSETDKARAQVRDPR
jgi:hypothetical protein